MTNKCQLCGVNHTPQPMDEYHIFLEHLQNAQKYLNMANDRSDKLPSIQIQLQLTIKSMNTLRDEAKRI